MLRQFIRFSVVGGVGFFADAGALFLMIYGFSLDPYYSRFGSFLFAATLTWFLHRNYTFLVRDVTPIRQWFNFLVFNGSGMALNLFIYMALIGAESGKYSHPMAAVTISSGVAYLYNYFMSRRYVFNET